MSSKHAHDLRRLDSGSICLRSAALRTAVCDRCGRRRSHGTTSLLLKAGDPSGARLTLRNFSEIRELLTHICCAFFGCLLLTTVDIKDTSWFDFRRKNGAWVSALELYLSHQIINTIDFIVFETSPLIRLIYSLASSAVHFVQLLRVLELNVVQAQQRSGMRWSGDALWHPSHFLCRRVMSQLWPALSAGGPCKHLLSLSVTRTFVLCCSGANGIRSELCTSIRQTAWTVQYSSRLLKVLCNHHLH